MSKTHDISECANESPEQLAAWYSAGTLVHGNQVLFDLYGSPQSNKRLAQYLPDWVDRDDIQWSYMGYSFEDDLFVVGFSGATTQGGDVDGYYLFSLEEDAIMFQGLGVSREVGVYDKLLVGLDAMYTDLVDLQLD